MPQPAAPTIDRRAEAAEALDAALRGLVSAYEEMLKLAALHRAAIQHADVRALADVMAAQAAVADRVTELEQQRQAAAAAMMKAAGIAGSSKVTIAQLVRSIAEPARVRLLALADRLRELLNKLHTEHMALREAAQALAGHMEGLMRQVYRRLSHSGTYGRTGTVDTGGAVVTTLDVRS